MGQTEDIGFTFDPHPFLNGLKQVSDGIGKLGDRTVAATKTMGKAFTWALIKVEALKGMLKMAISGIKSYMPEIDKTFSIAKDIMLKNFLWPIRQAIAPYLQKILDWVRDNRAMFIKWGATLVNVFKGVVQIVKALWTGLKGIIDIFKPFVQNVVKGGLQDIIDTLIIKVLVLSGFLVKKLQEIGTWLSPIITMIAGIVGDAARIVWGALTGFFDAVKGLDVKSTILDLLGMLKELTGSQGVQDLARSLGELAGVVVKEGWKMLSNFIEGIKNSTFIKGVTSLAEGVSKFIESIIKMGKESGAFDALDKLFNAFGKLAGDTIGKALEAISSFLDGFRNNSSGIGKTVQIIADAFTALMKAIDGLVNSTNAKGLSKWFGEAFGSIVSGVGSSVAGILNAASYSIAGFALAIEKMKAKTPAEKQDIANQMAELEAGYKKRKAQNDVLGKEASMALGASIGIVGLNDAAELANLKAIAAGYEAADSGKGRLAAPIQTKDAIITKDGKVIQTDPQDDIFAMKRGGNGGSSNSVSVSITGTVIQISVPSGVDPEAYSRTVLDQHARLTADAIARSIRLDRSLAGVR